MGTDERTKVRSERVIVSPLDSRLDDALRARRSGEFSQ